MRLLRFLTLALCASLLLAPCASANDDVTGETGGVIYAFADTDYNNHYSGEGNTDTDITHETTIDGSSGDGSSDDGSSDLPIVDQEKVEDQEAMDDYNDAAEAVDQNSGGNSSFIEGENNTYILVESTDIPADQLLGMTDILGGLNDPSLDFSLPDYNAGLTIRDQEQGALYDNALYSALLDYQMEKYLEGYFNLVIDDLPAEYTTDPSGWQGVLNGSYLEYQLEGTSICFPTNGQDLYNSMLPYLSDIISNGDGKVGLKKIEVYSIATYGVRTIKTYSPLQSYHWIVTGEGQSVDTYTAQDYIKILFQSSGTYAVQVYNTQNVIRNNKVGGTKTELWVLDTGDVYNGIVVYHHSTSFEAFIGSDVGPTEEEIELLEDGFVANITDRMTESVQFIDANGNIHSSVSDFTTEKIE